MRDKYANRCGEILGQEGLYLISSSTAQSAWKPLGVGAPRPRSAQRCSTMVPEKHGPKERRSPNSLLARAGGHP